jgi:hypothetical protein
MSGARLRQRNRSRPVTRTILAALALLPLAACATRPAELAVVAPPVVRTVPIAPAAPPPLSAMNANLSTAGTVWHVRAALNVAALACRGAQEAVIVANYNAMLKANAPGLTAAEAALAAEYKATGGAKWRDSYDDAMTKLYNFFSQNGGREAFCATAATALADAQTVTPDAFPAFAAARLPLLDAAFAPAPLPVQTIALAAAAPIAPAPRPTPVAMTAPRLQLDLSGLK